MIICSLNHRYYNCFKSQWMIDDEQENSKSARVIEVKKFKTLFRSQVEDRSSINLTWCFQLLEYSFLLDGKILEIFKEMKDTKKKKHAKMKTFSTVLTIERINLGFLLKKNPLNYIKRNNFDLISFFVLRDKEFAYFAERRTKILNRKDSFCQLNIPILKVINLQISAMDSSIEWKKIQELYFGFFLCVFTKMNMIEKVNSWNAFGQMKKQNEKENRNWCFCAQKHFTFTNIDKRVDDVVWRETRK